MGLAVLGILIFIFYQDMRHRGVFWVVFPILFLLLLITGLEQHAFSELLYYGAVNCIFLLLQLLLLSGYFAAKQKRLVNITEGYLGWGDILFLVAVSIYLSPLNYLSFYIGSLLLTLVPIAIIGFSRTTNIPLAGYQALLFACALISDWNIETMDLSSDNWLLKYFTYGYIS